MITPCKVVLGSALLLLTLVFTLSATPANTQGGIAVSRAWVRAIPPVVKNTAGYLEILNHGKEDDQLVGVSTIIAKAVEIHKVFKSGGMLEMRPVKFVPIPAGGKAELKPGGYHLMIIGLKRAPKTGEKVELILDFKHAGKLVVIARVREGEAIKHGQKAKSMKGMKK